MIGGTPTLLDQAIQWLQIAAIFLQVVYFIAIPVIAFMAMRQFRRLVDHKVGMTPVSAETTGSASDDRDLKVDEFVD